MLNLKIELNDKQVEQFAGYIYVVPKGVEHNPVAKNERLVMLIEKKSTQHTGELINKNSKGIQQ